jgi:hypothetical protein
MGYKILVYYEIQNTSEISIVRSFIIIYGLRKKKFFSLFVLLEGRYYSRSDPIITNQ